ncbi:MAG: tetratricopeptide repeat protein [Gammaproteobacteria bacterium]|nr:tetratricopeptide repeat protein [Gammaproteobacteria bacterium]
MSMKLDSDELLHLAIHASNQDRHDDAIRMLKEAVEQDPNNAFNHYMLAAEYATVGLYDRALGEFKTTVEQMPDLKPARIQYALLLIATNQNDEALPTLKPLQDTETPDCYTHFSNGLVALIDEDLEKAKQDIQNGINENNDNLPLNNDFEKIIVEIDSRLDEKPEDENVNQNSFFLSSYQNQ